MGISNFTLTRLYQEMKDFLIGAKIERIINISDTSFLMSLYKEGKCKSLLLSLDASLPVALLCDSYRIDNINPTNYCCNMLKKYYDHGTVNDFYKVNDDRIFVFQISKWTPSYQKIETKLIFEMFPLSPNIIIVDKNEIILDAFKRSESIDSKHPIYRNMHYKFPQSTPKSFNETTSLEDLKGKINKSELKYLENLESEKYYSTLKAMFNEDKYYYFNNDISSLPISNSAKKLTMEELFFFILDKKTLENKENKYNHIFKLIEQKIKSAKKRIINLCKDKEKFENASSYQEKGNLLYLGSNSYKRGDKEVIIEGIKISLDPKLDLNENAQRYFKLYKKSKTGAVQVEIQKKIAKDELDYFERLHSQVQFASPSDMEEIILDLCENHYIREHKVQIKAKKKPGNKKYTPHYIKLPSGKKIGYGLSSFQNEELTFSVANKNDLYLHIKDFHGPHVILFGENYSEDELLLAGEIALYFASKDAGEVYYTPRKFVKKVPGKRGLTTMSEYKVMVINNIRDTTLTLLRQR